MKIAVYGTGTIGLVSSTCYAELGHDVTLIDRDTSVIERLKRGDVLIYEPGFDEKFHRNVRDGKLHFGNDIKPLLDLVDLVVCAVPTPVSPDGTVELKGVASLAREIGQTVTKYFAVLIMSTVPVGTTRQLKAALNIELEKRGANIHYDLISVPSFLREGTAVSDFMHPDRLVAGISSEKGEELVRTLYSPLLSEGVNLLITDQTTAEMIKYASNAMLSTRFSNFISIRY